MPFVIYQGDIIIKNPNGKKYDYETFIITRNPDNSKTMHTLTRSPAGDLLRDVNQTEGIDWKPKEGIGKLFFKDKLIGTIVRKLVKNKLHSWIWKKNDIIDYKIFAVPKKITLGFHPIFHDAWKMNFLSIENNNLQEILTYTSSNTWNGSSLDHGKILSSRARFNKIESISVPAGKFTCRKYTWYTPFKKELIIWCSGEDNIFVKLEVIKGKNKGTTYELSNLDVHSSKLD